MSLRDLYFFYQHTIVSERFTYCLRTLYVYQCISQAAFYFISREGNYYIFTVHSNASHLIHGMLLLIISTSFKMHCAERDFTEIFKIKQRIQKHSNNTVYQSANAQWMEAERGSNQSFRHRGRWGKTNTLTLNPYIFLYVDKIMHPLLWKYKTWMLNIFTMSKRKNYFSFLLICVFTFFEWLTALLQP